MILTKIERDSVLWTKLTTHLNGLLEKDRKALEKQSLSEAQTASLRGSIKTLRQLLSIEAVANGDAKDGAEIYR